MIGWAAISDIAITHHGDWLPIPIEIRSHISATMTAGCADETRLNVGQIRGWRWNFSAKFRA